ncbi:TolC family protein [Gelidibacter japonicus]|uniref:TolC family protein n=1 Tax=Gelidibacter japonicus TaxID=1962232 RepID=UPI001F073F09|nr:TolC family protein [Gelidibacter japonicus]
MKKITILLLFTSSTIFAQIVQQELTLSQAINYALEHKASVQNARWDIKKGDAEIGEVRASALPNIAIDGNTSYNPLLQETVLPGEIVGIPGEDIRVAFGLKWSSMVNAQLTQTLFNQQVFTGLKAAKSTKEFYILNAELTEEDVIEKVATAYYQVFEAKEMLNNVETNIELAEQALSVIEGLYESGLAKKIDMNRSTVALNNIKANRQQLINSLSLSENVLKFMIGMDINASIDLAETSFEPTLLPQNETPLIEQRTELKVLDKQLELLEWQYKATKAEYYPTASLVANYGWLGQGNNFTLTNGESNGVYWSDLASIGVNIRIPVFSGFGTKNRVQQNKIDIEKAKLNREDTRLAFELDHQNALSELENNLITIQNQNENVQLANTVFSDVQNNYSLGLATVNELLDAERELANAKNNLTKAQLNYKRAEVALLKAQGRLNILSE